MLAQERFERILEILREKQSVTVTDLTKWLNTSESTIRRDLTELNRQGLLIKVHGGATAVKSVLSREEEVITKAKKHQSEKRKIGEYAASLINKEDMVYLDAGTTTEMIIDFLKEYDVIYVTNGIDEVRGFTTPDMKEAAIKRKAMEQCQQRYILTDQSKFDQISTFKFADLKKANIITDHLKNNKLREITTIEEVFS